MESVIEHSIRSLASDVDFHVVSDTLAADLIPLVVWHRVPTPKRPFSVRFPWFWVRAARVLSRLDVDVVHVTGALVPNRAHVSSIHFCHAAYIDQSGHLAPAEYGFIRRLHRGIARVMAVAAERWCFRPARLRRFAPVSDRVASELATHFPEIDSTVVPNGVDLDRFRPDASARSSVRAELDIDPDAMVLVFVGGDWERKGLQLIVEAIAATGRGREFSLIVVGPGDARSVEALARHHGLEGCLQVVGLRPDPERYLAAADALVLATEYETFSLVTYEAAATGLPVIATNVGGVTDIIDDETGSIVDRSVDGVATALEDLLSDPEGWARRGDVARRRAEEFGWDAHASAMRQVYELVARDVP